MSNDSSYFTLREFSLSSIHAQNSRLLNFPINFILNFDKVALIESSSFQIYQGHHGDVNAINSNLILPSTSFIEKNTFYSNTLAIVQKTKKVLFNPGNSRDDWKILNALIDNFGFFGVARCRSAAFRESSWFHQTAGRLFRLYCSLFWIFCPSSVALPVYFDFCSVCLRRSLQIAHFSINSVDADVTLSR